MYLSAKIVHIQELEVQVHLQSLCNQQVRNLLNQFFDVFKWSLIDVKTLCPSLIVVAHPKRARSFDQVVALL